MQTQIVQYNSPRTSFACPRSQNKFLRPATTLNEARRSSRCIARLIMNDHKQSRRWLVCLCVVATLGSWQLQELHAAKSDEQLSDETSVEDSVKGTDTATPASISDSDTTGNDTGSGLTPPIDTTDPSVPTTDANDTTPSETGENTESGLGLTPPAGAADASSLTGDLATDAASKEQIAWDNFAPPPDSKFDWIQLVSGEWLKGELKSLYDFKLEFESDELDTLKFDWEDIIQIRTARFQAVRYAPPGRGNEPSTARGLLTLVGEKATIGSGPDAVNIDRSYIISIARGAERERDRWSGRLSIGANIRSGNADLTDANITARAERRRAISRYVAEYFGNFSSASGEETSNNHRLTTYFDQFKTAKLYWRVAYLEYVRDKFRNIEHQANVNTGIGYSIVRSPKKDWDVTASVGALYIHYVSVEPGNSIDNVSPALGLGTRYDQEITSTLDFLFDYNLQIVDEDNGSAIHHLVTTVSTEFIKDFEFDVSLVWDRVRNPQPAADGTVPKQDDFQMIFAVGYEF
jgi:hypothetical protein